MKLDYLILAFAFSLVGLSSANADVKYISFRNDSESAVTEVYVSAAGQQGWGPELLGPNGGPIPPGIVASVVIDDGLADCDYVLFARWDNDPVGSVHDTAINACSVTAEVLSSSGWCSPDYCDEHGMP